MRVRVDGAVGALENAGHWDKSQYRSVKVRQMFNAHSSGCARDEESQECGCGWLPEFVDSLLTKPDSARTCSLLAFVWLFITTRRHDALCSEAVDRLHDRPEH